MTKRKKRTKRTKRTKRMKPTKRKKQTSKRKNTRKKYQNTKGVKKYRQSGGGRVIFGDERLKRIGDLTLYNNDENMFIPYYLGMGAEGIVMLYLRNLNSLPSEQRERLKEYAKHWEGFYKDGDRKVPGNRANYIQQINGLTKRESLTKTKYPDQTPLWNLLTLDEDVKTFIDGEIPPENKAVVKLGIGEGVARIPDCPDPGQEGFDHEVRMLTAIQDGDNYGKYKHLFAELIIRNDKEKNERWGGEEKNERYMTTTYDKGISLDQYANDMGLRFANKEIKKSATEQILENLKDTKEIMKQLATGLAYLHSIGMIHCDLKPQNVLVDKDKSSRIKVTIIDFGLSVYQMEDEADLIERAYCCMKEVHGSSPFYSPEKIHLAFEQVQGLGNPTQTIGFTDDWWVFGIIFHLLVHASCGYYSTTEQDRGMIYNTFVKYGLETGDPTQFPQDDANNFGNYEFDFFKQLKVYKKGSNQLKQVGGPYSVNGYNQNARHRKIFAYRPSSFLFFGNRDQAMMTDVENKRQMKRLPPVKEWPDNLLTWTKNKLPEKKDTPVGGFTGIFSSKTNLNEIKEDEEEGIKAELVKCSDFYRNFFVADPKKRPFIALKDEVEKFGEDLTAADNLYDFGEQIGFF